MKRKIISLLLCIIMLLGVVAPLAGCSKGGKSRPDALVIMTDTLDGVFNPFYSTTAADGTIVSMTQIGMLTTEYKGGEAVIACGDEHAVVVKDYAISHDNSSDTTKYTFVIKNGIKFSDGKPLTMNDVLFNLYVYLDPVYTGSSTMYSTDIVGLKDYRTQTISSGNQDTEAVISSAAAVKASDRLYELINLFHQVGDKTGSGNYSASYNEMVDAIKTHKLSPGYVSALSNDPTKVTFQNLLDDYNHALDLFKEELETDYASAKEAYLEEPYKSTGEFDEITSFMYAEGFVTLKYEENPTTGKLDKSKIKEVVRDYPSTVVKDKASAINYVFESITDSRLDAVLLLSATANTLLTEYTAKGKEVVLREKMKDGELAVKNISGIVSLGHTSDVTSVTANGGTYTVAHEHNPDGTVKNEGEYDVLEITINGVDPKAIWNFAFTVAPQHYYAEGYTVDIVNNKFGVEFNSFDYMSDVIQSLRNINVPMGAGPYVATDASNRDNPDGNAFFKDNTVYFKANTSFLLGSPKIEKVRYQVVSSSNAINVLEKGYVHFVTPQFTQTNIEKLDSLSKSGIEKVYTKQLGYGYIGINAGKVPNINIRKAIMCAMDTSLALSYYSANTAEAIYWPMSTVSWAYPKNADGSNNRDNMHEYPSKRFNEEEAKELILDYMAAAGVTDPENDSSLSLTFTIAGSNLTEHPTYQTFQGAADLLNSLGWDVEVVPDTQALTKLSTGSLEVWAAAWGTTIDPDMYQVYHKNSTATSTLAWGYREILASPGLYAEEYSILQKLSNVIDSARAIEDRTERARLYKEAMGYVLDLAVELPVYQRNELYAYNAKVIDTSTLPSELNPYSSPLDHIWEIDFAN